MFGFVALFFNKLQVCHNWIKLGEPDYFEIGIVLENLAKIWFVRTHQGNNHTQARELCSYSTCPMQRPTLMEQRNHRRGDGTGCKDVEDTSNTEVHKKEPLDLKYSTIKCGTYGHNTTKMTAEKRNLGPY